MREIINIQIGQCGNQIATKYWEFISEEHGIDPNGVYQGDSDIQLRGINTHYHEGAKGKYVPRNILIDLDPATEDSIRGGVYGNLFRPDSYISGHNGTGNNWGKGHYTEGSELVDRFMDLIRKEIEMCDNLHGFQIIHSIGGGTGSGLGCCLIGRVREEYPDRMFVSSSVFPSKKVSDIIVEPYNAVLTTHILVDSCDYTQIFDNESLYNICARTSLHRSPTYSDLNHLVAGAMAGTTSSLRFPGQLNSCLRKLATNLVPYPRVHFLMVSYAPLALRGQQYSDQMSVPDLITSLFSPENTMCDANFKEGRFITASINFRGQVPAGEVGNELKDFLMKNSDHFLEWIPDSFKSTFCDVPPKGVKTAGTLMANSSAVQTIFKKLEARFTSLFRRKAYLHWYTSEGMDEMEFTEAESNMNDLVSEYQGAHNDNYYFHDDDEIPLYEEEV